MAVSVFDLFKIGIGPSSSHTVGPMRAARLFVQRLARGGRMAQVARVRSTLYGSLGATGRGHASDRAVLLGLCGHAPDTVDVALIDPLIARIRGQHRLPLEGGPEIAFDLNADLPLIAQALLERSASTLGKTVTGFAGETLDALAAYPWPGNVRELQNEILRMVALADGPLLEAGLLSPRVAAGGALTAAPEEAPGGWADGLSGNLRERMEQLELRVLQAAMRRHGGNKSRASRELGLSRVGLRAKLNRHGIVDE